MSSFNLSLMNFCFLTSAKYPINVIRNPKITTVSAETRYSNLNKQYSSQYDGEEYIQKRMEINRNLEKELTENLPYLESRQIKKIVIDFSKEQDKL